MEVRRPLVDDVVDGGLVLEEVRPDDAPVDGGGTGQRGHAPDKEQALEREKNESN